MSGRHKFSELMEKWYSPEERRQIKAEAMEELARTEGAAMKQADRIREYAIEHCVKPARDAGERSVSIRAGDVHKAMKLDNRVPAVCGALRTEEFQDRANVELKGCDGPFQSTTTTFHYKVL